MLQTMIEGNSGIYHALAVLHDRYGEKGAETYLDLMKSVSWGVNAPRKSYATLSKVYGYLSTLYCDLFLMVHLTQSRKVQKEMELVIELSARVEMHLNQYARYMAEEGRDRI